MSHLWAWEPFSVKFRMTEFLAQFAYASRSLSDVERRCSQIEREGLSVKFGCLKFDHYLSGDPGFTIITDHKPLLSLYKPGSRPPQRIENCALCIQLCISNFAISLTLRIQQMCFRDNQPHPRCISTPVSGQTPELSTPLSRLHSHKRVLSNKSKKLQRVIRPFKLSSHHSSPVHGMKTSLVTSVIGTNLLPLTAFCCEAVK